MRECQIKHERQDEVDILRLDGALDLHSFTRLDNTLLSLRSQSRHRIVLDCTHLDYINSAALGALIGFARRARENGGDLKLASLTPKIFSIMELLGFDKVLQIFPDAQTAIAKFSR